MKKRNTLMLIIILAVISLVLYIVNILIFKDIHHVAIFALEDLAFVPIEVICVTLIFRRVLVNNERKKKVSKLYMVIATFYSEVGTELLRAFANNDVALKQIESEIAITQILLTALIKDIFVARKEFDACLIISAPAAR